MRLRTVAPLLLAVLAGACSARKPDHQVSTPLPVGGAATGRAARVVLVSMDGLAALHQGAMVRRGAYRDPDGLGAFGEQGFVVDEAVPVDPPLTAVSHAAIATGAFPSATGIVSNLFHLPGTPLTRTVSGFDAPWHTEALWQAFRRQGKRVGVLLFPGCDATDSTRTADFGMLYPTRALARAHTERLAADRFTPAGTHPPAGTRSFAPTRSTTLTVSLRDAGSTVAATFHLTALDTSDDGAADYDALAVDDDDDTANGVLAVARVHDWFPLRVSGPAPDGGTRTIGAWCLLQRLPADLDGVVIYVGGFHATLAYPRSFRERLEASAGFWPGEADDGAVARGLAGEPGLAPDEYLAQIQRLSTYLVTCFHEAVATEPFDLLLAYQPIVDEVQHAFTVTDPRQRDYSPGLAATAATIVDTTYGMADRAVGAMSRCLELRRDAFVVVSDHGIAPIWETVYVNEALRRAGLVTHVRGGRGDEVAPTSPTFAVTSGGVAHVYVNLAGREAGGVVLPGDLAETVSRAARTLALLDVDGEPVVEAAYTRAEAARVGLDSPNSGDLVVFFNQGFYPSSRLSGVVHEPATFHGQHGYLNMHPEMAAVWLARGAGVPHRHVARLSLTEVAAFVAELAGVQPPAGAHPFAP